MVAAMSWAQWEISGDTSENDEECAIAGIEAAGLKADAG